MSRATLKRGDIVLTPFPFTDLSTIKIRPALVVSKKMIGDNITIVFISSKVKNYKKQEFDLKIIKNKSNNLKVDSVIKCSKLATVDTNILIGNLGEISKVNMSKVDLILRKVLNL